LWRRNDAPNDLYFVQKHFSCGELFNQFSTSDKVIFHRGFRIFKAARRSFLYEKTQKKAALGWFFAGNEAKFPLRRTQETIGRVESFRQTQEK